MCYNIFDLYKLFIMGDFKMTEVFNETNEKLKDRAIRIVSQIADVSFAQAYEKLINCDWKIKTAIVSLKLNLSKEDADRKLELNSGVLRKVLNK